MHPILAITLPFFALVLMGYLAARQRVLPESAVPGLNAFVLYFALPAMLFRFGLNTPLAQLLNPALLAVSLVASLGIVAFTIALTLSPPRVGWKDASFGALVAAFPNSGFMGVPLLTTLLGPAAAGPLICALLIDLFITSSLCIALAQGHEARGEGTRAALVKALKGTLSNPLPWSIALGAAAAALGARGWLGAGTPVATLINMLADAASPVALFTIGAVLWRAGQHAHTRTPPSLYLPVAAIKLFVHPLVVFALALSARALGAPLGAFEIMVLTLTAALPSASNVSLLAERYGADNGRVARIILSTTALAFVSFSLLAWVFGVGGVADAR
jgi:malonate transporter and related proteins